MVCGGTKFRTEAMELLSYLGRVVGVLPRNDAFLFRRTSAPLVPATPSNKPSATLYVANLPRHTAAASHRSVML